MRCRSLPLLGALVVGAPGCRQSTFSPPQTPPLYLDRHPQGLVSVELPPSSRPGSRPAPDTVEVQGKPRESWRGEHKVELAVPMPVTQVLPGLSERRPPPELEVLDPLGRTLPYALESQARPEDVTWGWNGRSLLLRFPEDDVPPTLDGYRVRHPPSARWEDDLNAGTYGGGGEAFVLRRQSMGSDAWRGLLLPAPARTVWRVPVPAKGVLRFRARILPPGVRVGAPSDGAEVQVDLQAGGEHRELARVALAPGTWEPVEVDLSPWAGQEVRLVLATSPGEDARFDYVFLANPVVYRPRERPRRLAILLVDALRADRLGFSGYAGGTTPGLDRWLEGAVVFDNARAVAPWALPSVRAALSGRDPTAWRDGPVLPDHLAEAGFLTAIFTANPFLSPAFDMTRDWAVARHEPLGSAREITNSALAFLARHPHRDVALLVQYADIHPPYAELPAPGASGSHARPRVLDAGMGLERLRRIDAQHPWFEEVRTYLGKRYDQAIRGVDEQASRLIHQLGSHALVVLAGSSGEELWDHGGVGRGHALHEELVRVPLALRGPGLAPARVRAPVSLRDLTPTLLDYLGRGGGEAASRSLLSAAGGSAPAGGSAAVPLGYVLTGPAAWGVILGERKWVSRAGARAVYDLAADPEETRNLLATGEETSEARYVEALSERLGREVRPVWRVACHGRGTLAALSRAGLRLERPGGFARAWTDEPGGAEAASLLLQGDAVEVAWEVPQRLPRELFVIPAGEGLDPAGLRLAVKYRDQRWRGEYEGTAAVDEAGGKTVLLQVGEGGRGCRVEEHVAPLPAPPLYTDTPWTRRILEDLEYGP